MSESDRPSGLSEDFEEKIIQAALSDHGFGEQILEVLELEYFDKKHTQELAKHLLEHYRKYNNLPTVSGIRLMCEQEVKNPILKKECLAYIDKIQTKPLNGDSQYVQDKSLMFFRTQAIKNALLNEVIPKIKKENLEEILPIIQSAINKGTSKNVGYEYKEDEESRFIENEFNKVPTPWNYLNSILGGGWESKRLITVIGGSGAGKSHCLVDIGAGALLAKKEDNKGRTVVHYTLELSEVDVARRYDAFLTDIKINDIPKNKNKVLFALKQKLPKDCNLIIKEYPMWTASVQTIKAHLARLKLKGIVPDLIIIDYGDLLSTVENFKEERFKTSSIWGSLKSLAQELNIPIITATQSNREGYNAEVLTADKVSEDFKKIMHSDVILTMARNIEQKASGIGKMLMAKNRQGQDGQIFAFTIDTSKSKIDMFELTEDVEEKIEKELGKLKQESVKDDLKSMDSYIKNIKADSNE